MPISINVIVAGESGIGKSSLINLITGHQLANTSNDSSACTLSVKGYRTSIDGHDFVLWDTPGFNEGLGAAPSVNYLDTFRSLIEGLGPRGGVDLVLYCMLASRAKIALMNNYFAVCAHIPKSTPVVVVVTSLERCPGRMEDWWIHNQPELTRLGMTFVDHACITALPDCVTLSPLIRERIADSRKTLRDVIRRACLPYCISPSLVSFPTSSLSLEPTRLDPETTHDPASGDGVASTMVDTYPKLQEPSWPLRRRRTTFFRLPSGVSA